MSLLSHAALIERCAVLEAELAQLRAENATLRAAQVPAQRTDEPHDHSHGWGRQRPPIAEDIA